MSDPQAIERGHQSSDERNTIVVTIAILLVVFMVIAAVVGLFILDAAETPDTVPAMGLPTRDRVNEFPAPRLQNKTGVDMQELRKDEHQLLTQYEWIDREAGTARIPIERAMKIVLERGFPVRKK